MATTRECRRGIVWVGGGVVAGRRLGRQDVDPLPHAASVARDPSHAARLAHIHHETDMRV